MLHFRREITYEIQIAFINLSGQISLLMINNSNDLYQIVYTNEIYTHGLFINNLVIVCHFQAEICES